ncbi:hypothetical protein J40TS1_30780 [Paenibacillus montaniterrae]|uniref:Uncharacterized protein n=1 Tax=Paenibacillus montaniterrae TaxID=429341 RepID=A0A920CY02_9BACL|nr:hypothetical protein J40TS1_30780 [Paenibacillus montaniterrae]
MDRMDLTVRQVQRVQQAHQEAVLRVQPEQKAIQVYRVRRERRGIRVHKARRERAARLERKGIRDHKARREWSARQVQLDQLDMGCISVFLILHWI